MRMGNAVLVEAMGQRGHYACGEGSLKEAMHVLRS